MRRSLKPIMPVIFINGHQGCIHSQISNKCQGRFCVKLSNIDEQDNTSTPKHGCACLCPPQLTEIYDLQATLTLTLTITLTPTLTSNATVILQAV